MFGSRNEPEIRYESSTSLFALIGAIGVGAALMYFLDPDNGRRRRALVKDQVAHGKVALQDATEAAVRNAANRTRGALARVQGSIATRDEPVDDVVLGERVRAAMGHVVSDPHAIEIRVHEGCVTLKGPALPHEIGELVACAERVRGVREVENRLSVSNPS
jgi:osmotically-inducible protein OsmY